jgi:hypothetical protein
MIRSVAVLLLLVLLLLPVGCGQDDFEAEVDFKITEEWMQPGMYVDAIEYLETGGHYETMVMPGSPGLDQTAILPFLKRLKAEFDQEQYAILLEEEPYCWGIVVRIPDEDPQRQRFQEFLNREDDDFPGMILQEWGHEWVSLDFLNEEAAAVIREGEAAADAAS